MDVFWFMERKILLKHVHSFIDTSVKSLDVFPSLFPVGEWTFSFYGMLNKQQIAVLQVEMRSK